MLKYTSFAIFAVLILACNTKGTKSDLLEIAYAPSFSYTNQRGETIDSKSLEGKVYVVEFFFTTCPGICKVMNANLLKVQKKFIAQKDFAIISFSVDPDNDTPEVLQDYADRIGIQHSQWHLLTGDRDSIYDMARHGFLSTVMEDENEPGGFLHTDYMIVVDKRGKIRMRKDKFGNPLAFSGTDSEDIFEMKNYILQLLKE